MTNRFSDGLVQPPTSFHLQAAWTRVELPWALIDFELTELEGKHLLCRWGWLRILQKVHEYILIYIYMIYIYSYLHTYHIYIHICISCGGGIRIGVSKCVAKIASSRDSYKKNSVLFQVV